MLAVAAGVLQPVVLQLERVVSAAAAAAVAAPDDPRFKMVGQQTWLLGVPHMLALQRALAGTGQRGFWPMRALYA